MNISIRWLTAGISLACAGCTIHPNSQDFSRNTIPDIVRKVRCEAQDAVRQHGINKSHPLVETALAFDFEFTLTEANVAGVGGSFVVPISLGSFTMGYSAAATKDRESTQKVKFSDSFGDLLYNLTCDEHLPHPNIVYPITGRIGLLSTFDNFLKIQDSQRGDELELFTDEVKFTTTLSAGVNPQIDLAPSVGRSVSVSGSYSVSRIDLHRVSIAFDAPPTQEQKRDAKADKVAALAFERSLPYKVQFVDERGHPVPTRALGLPSGVRPETVAPRRPPTAQAMQFVPSPTLRERKKRVLLKLEDSRTQILNRRLLERVR